MKKCWMILGLALLLSGCGSQPTFETVADVYDQPVSAVPQQILLDLPTSAQVPTLQSEDAGTIYFCDDLNVSVQTLEGGDLDRTLQTATGYSKDSLCVMQSYAPEGKCYECAFITAGEGQLQVGRTRIIDDGSYHYVVTILVPEEKAGQLQEQVQPVLDSFRVVDADFSINTGS